MKTIREYLYPGATTRIIAHTMVWFDGYTHPVQKDRDPGYRSNNAEQVRAQCEQLKACQVDILMYNWYGPNNAFLNESTHNYFNVSPLGHMINIDGGGFHSRDELLSHMRYVRSNFLTHPNYEKWRDKYIVTLFAKSGNDPEWFRALEQENPDCVFAYNSTNWGISQYEWIDPNLEGGVDWFCRTFGDRSDGLFIPAFFPGFNDDNGQGQSVWSPLDQPASGRRALGPTSRLMKPVLPPSTSSSQPPTSWSMCKPSLSTITKKAASAKRNSSSQPTTSS